MDSNFFALISRMRYIARWGLMRNALPENIQEHSHMVAARVILSAGPKSPVSEYPVTTSILFAQRIASVYHTPSPTSGNLAV